MRLRFISAILLITLIGGITNVFAVNKAVPNRELSFDTGWRFLRADAPGADAFVFDDSAWRLLDLPHDWSVDDLPSTNGAPPRPFDPALSAGGAATGYVVGGIGWYRKHFTLPPSDLGKTVTIRFDGVYMNSDVWINGQHLGNHPYGYTPFVYDLTPYLKPAGQENLIAVQVKNTGKNSRWYSGSGIYRHVWLTVTDPVHVPVWGVHVVTTNISKSIASVSVSTTIENNRGSNVTVRLSAYLVGPNAKATRDEQMEVSVPAGKQQEFTQEFSVKKPALWSLDHPALYRAEVELVDGNQVIDQSGTTFGIRTLEFSAAKGFLLNGEVVKLKGGCMHHDDGPLGSAAIDRAEDRRVQLMKAYGYNAIRTSHNPPSSEFLDACDRYGVLVLDEAFDCWEKGKNPDDYHLYFDEWWQRDLQSMILRDRNHPCVILWSIGNEINERAEPAGIAISKKMIDAIRPLDSTRPVTEAICGFWDHRGKNWSETADAFAALDVGGYNYERQEYEPDHNQFPSRIMVGTESYPLDVAVNWQAVLKDPWVIGDFEWTSWDYMGETGIGNATLSGERGATRFPWYVSNCGDIDMCGFEKPPHFCRAVVWGDAKIALAIHAPIPAGHTEKVSGWGWPDERQSWTWPGSEGAPLDVTVYSSSQSVRLELNGKAIATEPVDDKMAAHFRVPYQPGELRAVGLTNNKRIASFILRTCGNPEKIRLTADRSAIRADRNDLSFIKVEVIDRNGDVVPTAAIPIHFTVSGAGELAATGNGAPDDASSFHVPVRKTYEGRCLAILKPEGVPGKITLRAEADGLKPGTIVVKTR